VSNPTFIKIRQAVIDDVQHSNCNDCWQRELNGDTNSRRSVYQYDDFYHELESTNTFRLEYLDLRWSNTCNLNCVYCSPTFSSKWAELTNAKQKYRVAPVVTEDNLSNLKVLQLAGGEPLLLKENIGILEKLLIVNPDVNIEITTNLTSIHNNRIYDLLKKFINITWVVSFEAIGNRFNYIRNGAKWEEFLANLKVLSRDFSKIQVNMVYFPLSSFGIIDAINVALEFTDSENIFLVSQIGGQRFDQLSQSVLQYIHCYNRARITELPHSLQTKLEQLMNLAETTQIQTYLPMYDRFDLLTKQNHREIFKELYEQT
jgi:molybdenum cofactor biosynthesis enzyme MoaA